MRFLKLFLVLLCWSGIALAQEPGESVAGHSEKPVQDSGVYPSFGGGDIRTFRSWVMSRVRYPAAAVNKGIHGRVVVSFVVGRDGSIGQVEVLKTPSPILSKEVLRVMKRSPKWTPGRQRDSLGEWRTVNVKYTLPVDFSLPF